MEYVIVETTPAWRQPTQREVADLLGISQKAVWETEQRALRKLEKLLADDRDVLFSIIQGGWI